MDIDVVVKIVAVDGSLVLWALASPPPRSGLVQQAVERSLMRFVPPPL